MVTTATPLPLAEDEVEGLGPQLQALERRLRAVYEEQGDWDQIDGVIQDEGETVVHYEARLREAFDRHSGVPRRKKNRKKNPRYVNQLKCCLMRGSRLEITGWIKRHFIGWQNATLPNIISYAKYAEKVVATKQKKGGMK